MFAKTLLSHLILLSIVIQGLLGERGRKLDVQKIYRAHAQCNGEDVSLPAEWMPKGLIAAAQCMDIEDEYCQKQCVAFAYPGVMKNGRIDMVWVRKESKKLRLSKRNERAREELLKGAEKCAEPLPKLERPTGEDSCPEAKEFEKCMEEEFGYACKGKKRPKEKTDPKAFLNDEEEED